MDYAALQTKAASLIADKGQAVTLTRKSAGAYNVATATATLTDTVTTTTGVVLPLSTGVRGVRYGEAEQKGTNVLSSDQQLLLPGSIAEPSANDIATIGGKKYTIIGILPTNPAGTALIYECVIRGVS